MKNEEVKTNEVAAKCLKFEDMQDLEMAFIRGEIVIMSVEEYNKANNRFADLQEERNYLKKRVDYQDLLAKERLMAKNNKIEELENQLKTKSNNICEEFKNYYNNNFYFDISGLKCVALDDLDEFLELLCKR